MSVRLKYCKVCLIPFKVFWVEGSVVWVSWGVEDLTWDIWEYKTLLRRKKMHSCEWNKIYIGWLNAKGIFERKHIYLMKQIPTSVIGECKRHIWKKMHSFEQTRSTLNY